MGWTRATVLKVARRTGRPVVEAWSGHNAGTMGTVVGPMLHHTGTPESYTSDYPTLRVVRDGRAGLSNSLAMYGIGRSGTIYCFNDKISWHAGIGDWNGITDGNGHFAGIEAEGPYGTWPAAEVDSYERLVASILIETGRGQEWAPTHGQWANPPGRKTDPSNLDMGRFKANVQRYLNNPALLGGAVKEEDIMASLDDLRRVFDEKKESYAQRNRQVVADGTLPYGLDRMRRQLEALAEQVQAVSDKLDALNKQ